MEKVSKDIQEDVKEAFDFYDKDETGMIFTPDIKPAMRMLGMNPKAEEVENISKIVSLDGQTCGYPEFSNAMAHYLKDVNNEEEMTKELMTLFEGMDRDNKGFITVDDLKYVMANFGDQMNEEDVAELAKTADTAKDGKIHYAAFIEKLLKP